MAEQNRNSRLAIVEEVTEGTLVEPSVGTEFIALQAGFAFAPNFENLENDEIRASIGRSKSILGLERPDASFNHYMRASGVEGTAPGFRLLLKAVFGSENVNSTERTTTAGSTVSVIELAAGGSDFARGRALLIKDGTNGFSVRNVQSVATNSLTLGRIKE